MKRTFVLLLALFSTTYMQGQRTLTLEECLEFIDDDELLEITPKSLRMRKRELNHEQRARAAYRAKQ